MLTRRQQQGDGLSTESIIAIILITIAVIVLIVSGVVIFQLRHFIRAARQCSNCTTSPRTASEGRPIEIRERSRGVDSIIGLGSNDDAILSPYRQRPDEDAQFSGENKTRHLDLLPVNEHVERLKMEFRYARGGVGETPTTPSIRPTPTVSQEPATFLRDHDAPQLPPKEMNAPIKQKKRPELPALITEFPLASQFVQHTLHSNSVSHDTSTISNNHGRAFPPKFSRSTCSSSTPSLPSIQKQNHQREASESSFGGSRQHPNLSIMSPTISTDGRPAAPRHSFSADPSINGPRIHSSKSSRDIGIGARRTSMIDPSLGSSRIATPPAALVHTGTQDEEERQILRSEPQESSASASTRRKPRVLSSIATRHVNRPPSTSTYNRSSRGTTLRLSHPPPPYTAEDIDPSVPPLPIKPPRLPELVLPSFHVTNVGDEARRGFVPIFGSQPELHVPSRRHDDTSREVEHRVHGIDANRTIRHQPSQHIALAHSRPRSSSSPNNANAAFLDPAAVDSTPLPARREGPSLHPLMLEGQM